MSYHHFDRIILFIYSNTFLPRQLTLKQIIQHIFCLNISFFMNCEATLPYAILRDIPQKIIYTKILSFPFAGLLWHVVVFKILPYVPEHLSYTNTFIVLAVAIKRYDSFIIYESMYLLRNSDLKDTYITLINCVCLCQNNSWRVFHRCEIGKIINSLFCVESL